ncbi:MAG: 30S ribosomal protein S12 methylthiotransferase RimO [Polyangiales bacterium]
MGAPRTIHFVSLGCAKNRVDTEVMLGVSDASGFTLVDDPATAEVIVVNTCGFIGPAKEESIDTILEMGAHKESGVCQKLVVAGCLSQRYPDQLSQELPEVDHFLGSSDMLKLGPVLRSQPERMLVGNPAEYTMRADDPRVLTEAAHRAYMKIAEGCNRSCSFCAIPSFRGKQRSRPVDDLVREAEQLAAAGVVELNLISQDTIAFGRDLERREPLAALLEALARVEGIEWIRAHYLYPEKLTDSLVDVIANTDKVLPYIDMPLQHASDNMLQRMRRGHGGERMVRVVERLRRAIPDLVFRTTFIVGHPGETDADFHELKQFVEWGEFDHVGVFLYSTEEGTKSGAMSDIPDASVAEARREELMGVQRPISRSRLDLRVGTELDVLVEGVSDESELLLQGRWWGQAPEVDGSVYLANGTAKPGEIRRVLVTDAGDYDLLADFVDDTGARDAPPDTKDPRTAKVKLRTLT